MKERKKELDIIRGLLIISVVVGHSSVNIDIVKVIYSFHMPCFFILSGVLLNVGDHVSIKGFISKKGKAYLIPYIFFAFFCSVFAGICEKISVIDILKSLFYPLIGGKYAAGVYWFVTVLLIAEILIFEIEKRFSLLYKILIYICLCGGSVCLSCNSLWVDKVRLPWGLEVVPMAIVYIVIGYYGKEFRDIYCKNKTSIVLICLLIVGSISYYVMNYTDELTIDMKYSIYPNLLIDILMPTSTFVILYYLSETIREQFLASVIAYIGMSAMVIMYTHLLVNKILAIKFNQEFNVYIYISLSICLGTLLYYGMNRNRTLRRLFLGKFEN